MISIIIPTFNRANLLKLTIQSLCIHNFSPKQYEIFLIGSGLIDNTKNITERKLEKNIFSDLYKKIK